MFRENVLTKPQIIDRITSTMVPVAVDFQKVQDTTSRESRFLKPMMEQRKQDQGVWIVSPDGKALGGFIGFGDMAGRMKQVIDDALEAFGSVEPRRTAPADTHPHRGKGVMADGSVCLAEYVRRYGNTLHQTTTSPVISSLTLSAKQFAALAPPEAAEGAQWTLPDDVAKRFCRLTSPLCYQHAPQPGWVTRVRIDARVREIKDGVARLTYEGAIASRQGRISEQETRLRGEATYDVTANRMRSVLIVGSGTLVWSEAPDQPVTFHALAEWTEQ
jgi:hypothetical protein